MMPQQCISVRALVYNYTLIPDTQAEGLPFNWQPQLHQVLCLSRNDACWLLKSRLFGNRLEELHCPQPTLNNHLLERIRSRNECLLTLKNCSGLRLYPIFILHF